MNPDLRVVRFSAPYGMGSGPDLRGGGGVDSPASACISPPVPEAIPGLFIGVGGLRKKSPVGPEGQRTTPFVA